MSTHRGQKALIFAIILSFISNFASPIFNYGASQASALSESLLDNFSANNIIFYNPEDCQQCAVSCQGADGGNVTVIGDSILADAQTKKLLMESLPGLSEDQYDATPSRSWSNSIESLNGLGILESRKSTLKNTVIINLGTNLGATADNLNKMLSIVGTERQIILVTPYTPESGEAQNTYETTGELYKQTAKSNPQITVFDWADVAKNNNVQFTGDKGGLVRVHPQTSAERSLYVDGIVSAIGGSCNSGRAIVSGSTAEEMVWSGFISMGIDEYATAGIMGNIAHEGLMNPAQWQVGHESKWGMSLREIYNLGSSNNTGMGMVAFTWYTWFDLLDKYYREVAPDLLDILEDPWTYSVADNGSHYCPGTSCFLKKVDANTAKRIYSTQITFIADSILGKYKDAGFDYHGIQGQSSPAAAAEWWLTNYERPANPEASRAARINSAEEYYNQFHGKTSFGAGSTGGTAGANCGGARAATAFKKYNFTDGQLRGIIAMAKNENGGSLSALQTEISVMANLYEKNGKKGSKTDEQAFIDYIKTGGWFASSTGAAYNESASVSSAEFDAAKDILNNGNRTLPQQILEHDCFYGGGCTAGITSASNNGVSFTYTDRSQYKRGVTELKNSSGATYIFYEWADPEKKTGDPFGYFKDNPPDENFSVDSTKAASSAANLVDIKWENGWIVSGMDGYKKGTPEMAGLTVGDSSPTMDYETNRPIDGKVGPNKILLHNTEGVNSEGQYGLDIYRGNPYPPHFTIDLRNKKVYQHFSVDKPSAAVASVDRSAGVQIEIIGFSTEANEGSDWYLFNTNTFGDDEWLYLAKLLAGISAYTGIKLETSVNWTDRNNSRYSNAEDFKNYTGILGHMHAYNNDHIDPGNIWPMLEKALQKVGVGTQTNNQCGEQNNSWTGDFPWWGQCEDEWHDVPYKSGGCASTVCSSGCGCTSFAMMATALTGTIHDPKEVCTYAGDQGMYVCGVGSSHSLPAKISDHFGLEHQDMGRPSIEEINSKLREGWMIWTCGSGSDPFTSGGHCIGVRGITNNNRWLLADSKSNGKEVTLEKDWDPSHVYSMMNTFQAIRKK